MTWTSEATGTQTAVIGTEHVLVAGATTNATYQMKVRCNNLVAGDIVELRVYLMTLAAGTLEQAWKVAIGPAPPINIVSVSVPQPSDQSIKFTLKQTAGTGRAFDWVVYRQ